MQLNRVLGRAIDQAVSHRILIAQSRVQSQVIFVGFMVDKVVLQQFFHRVLQNSLQIIILLDAPF
jgi:hypothetical protein